MFLLFDSHSLCVFILLIFRMSKLFLTLQSRLLFNLQGGRRWRERKGIDGLAAQLCKYFTFFSLVFFRFQNVLPHKKENEVINRCKKKVSWAPKGVKDPPHMAVRHQEKTLIKVFSTKSLQTDG